MYPLGEYLRLQWRELHGQQQWQQTIFIKSIKCHKFSESQAQANWNYYNGKDNKNDKVKYHRIYKDDNDDYNILFRNIKYHTFSESRA